MAEPDGPAPAPAARTQPALQRRPASGVVDGAGRCPALFAGQPARGGPLSGVPPRLPPTRRVQRRGPPASTRRADPPGRTARRRLALRPGLARPATLAAGGRYGAGAVMGGVARGAAPGS